MATVCTRKAKQETKNFIQVKMSFLPECKDRQSQICKFSENIYLKNIFGDIHQSTEDKNPRMKKSGYKRFSANY